jgi:hypothetical protein
MKRVIIATLFIATIASAQETPTDESPPVEPASAADVNVMPSTEKTATPTPKAAEPADETGSAAYRSKILELNGRVNDLKEKIFRTKTRLAILKENVLSKTIAGAEGRFYHVNNMGPSYVLEKVVYSYDGVPLQSLIDVDGDLNEKEEIELSTGPLAPGSHTLSVMMVYRGNGFGVFSYLKGYVYTLRSSHTFHAEEGKIVTVRTIAYEKGTITTDHRDRPDIRFETVLSEPARGNADNQDG